jgi:hypothetical protein
LENYSFISGNTYTVNGNQAFILDYYWPFICSVVRMGCHVTDEIWVFETRDVFEKGQRIIRKPKEETMKDLFYDSN